MAKFPLLHYGNLLYDSELQEEFFFSIILYTIIYEIKSLGQHF